MQMEKKETMKISEFIKSIFRKDSDAPPTRNVPPQSQPESRPQWFNQVSTSPATNPWGSQRDHTNETNALAQPEPDSRHSGEGERPTANLLGNGVKKTYIACTDPAYEPLVPTHEWVRRQNGWQYLEFASGYDAMVIRPEALTEVLFGCA
jgi:hypothetical protein